MENPIQIYVDGACSGNGTKTAIGGMGVHFKNGEFPDISKKYTLGNPTNNICELYAILLALDTVKDDSRSLEIYTDSSYCYGIFTNWLASWKKKGELHKKKNVDLILQIEAKIGKRKVTFFKVAGHNGCPYNNEADRLAVMAKTA